LRFFLSKTAFLDQRGPKTRDIVVASTNPVCSLCSRITELPHKVAHPDKHFTVRRGAQKGILTMRSSPKDIGDKIERMENAWEELAPNKSFGGMTLAEFRTYTAPSKAARARLADLDAQTTEAQADRDRGDSVVLVKAELIVNGVRADPTEGPDSALYEAMGYTRKSDRKSGLTRKAGSGSSTPPPAPK